MLNLTIACAFILALHTVLLTLSDAFSCSKSSLCQKEMEMMRVEEIKKGILDELGMSEPPQINTTKIVSAEMRKIYADVLRKYEEADDGANSPIDHETILVPALSPTSVSNIVRFEIFESLDNLIESRLSFFVRNYEIASQTRELNVQVFVEEKDGRIGEKVATMKGEPDESERVTVVLNADDVKRWYASESIRGLYVKAISVEDGGRRRQLHLQTEKMVLQLTMRKSSRKSKRAAQPICTKDSPTNGCCLYDLMIDFNIIGWDWIIAPPRYNAYICKGECKEIPHQVRNFHKSYNGYTKIMRAAIRMGNETEKLINSIGACCHPTEYENFRLVYINRNGRISVAEVSGMIARKCACS